MFSSTKKNRFNFLKKPPPVEKKFHPTPPPQTEGFWGGLYPPFTVNSPPPGGPPGNLLKPFFFKGGVFSPPGLQEVTRWAAVALTPLHKVSATRFNPGLFGGKLP